MAGEHRRAAIAIAVAYYVVLLAAPHAADGGTKQCLTPAAEDALRRVLTTGELRRTLAPSLTFSGVSVSADAIVVRADDEGRQPHAITLTLESPIDRPADGRGKRFAFYLTPSLPTDSSVRKALLDAGDMIDRAVPDAALGKCSLDEDHAPPSTPPRRQSDHVTRAVALLSAVVQVVVLGAATVFGWRGIRRS